MKHRRMVRMVCGVTAMSAVALGIGFASPASASRQYHSERSTCSPGGGISNAYYDTPASYQTNYHSPIYPYGYYGC